MSKKKGHKFTIRSARPGDEKAISELIYALAEYEKAPQDCHATPDAVARQLFATPAVAHAHVAIADGRIVAYAIYFLSFSTWLAKPGLYLEDLFVLPEYRKRGIGGALLRTLARLCVERGYGRMEWACLEWNELAKAQYRKIGAAPLEEWRTWRLTGEALAHFGQPEPEAQTLELDSDDAQQDRAQSPADANASGPLQTVRVYTDGGCRPNPGVGGWGAVLIAGEKEKDISGGEAESTNNRMELMAAIMALETLKKPCRAEIYTDSTYLRNGITTWIMAWKRKGWVTKEKTPVKNHDLWKRLDAACNRHQVVWNWVRGHAGDVYNERAHELCEKEMKAIEDSRR